MAIPWAAILSGAGSLASGGLGYLASQDAASNNAAIAAYNTGAERAENMLRRMIADRIRSEEQLGSTNMFGSRTYFEPGIGWVTTPDDRTRSLAEGSRTAQLYDVAGREPGRQEFAGAAANAARTENNLADAIAARMRTGEPVNREELRREIVAAGETGRNAQARDISRGVNAAIARQGGVDSSNLSRMISENARASSEAARGARADAAVQSRDIADEINTRNAFNDTELYQAMRNRAQGMPATPLTPATPPTRNMASANNLAFMGTTSTPLPYVQPDYSLANSIGSGANSLAQMMFLREIMNRGRGSTTPTPGPQQQSYRTGGGS